MNKDIQFIMLQCDIPSPYTGRIYPREEIEKAIAKYQETIDKEVSFGTLGIPNRADGTLNIMEISHKVNDITIDENGSVVASVDILDTPNGKVAQECIDALRLSPCMAGKVSEDMMVSECTLFHTALLNKDKDDE